MTVRKVLNNLDYQSVMHPDDKKTIDWLNSLKVPYKTNLQFVKEIATHPFEHNLKEWYEIFKAGTDYYTFNDFLRVTTSKYREACNEIDSQGEGVAINSRSYPQMYQQLLDACKILHIEQIPYYSTDWYYGPNHYSCGEKRRRIVMMSGATDLFTEDEMMYALGFDLGHFASGHKPYHMLIESFFLPFLNDGAFKAWATIVKLPLFEWYRCSNYTADRFGLLCCQDINVALSVMIKKAGLPRKCYDDINIDSFIKQARDFDDNFTGTANTIVKKLSIRSSGFPWLVSRASQLLNWYETGEYQKILDNN